jgi:hypothetical protein
VGEFILSGMSKAHGHPHTRNIRVASGSNNQRALRLGLFDERQTKGRLNDYLTLKVLPMSLN